ncbi:MAG: hypothetical protein MUF48_14905 [Pirellulaceae bacterium]|jgi:hypothetical protein|nr:hypothetical protein [Pirellulaceae bacterium]
MDARLFRAAVLVAVVCALGANRPNGSRGMAMSGGSCRSQHFIVTAPTPAFARQVCDAAEQFRRDLAIEWLGAELPPWQDVCPIYVKVSPQLGAGGATTFTFINGQPREWHMEIQGSQERILDSVLPHEITHTVFATHFGRPLPRWADEGACTSVEHASERLKQDHLLIQFLTTNRGIAFNHMFAMKDYPPDILPLYSQGYSLARYLIARGGKRKFVDYVGDGMQWNNWTAATQQHYGIRSLSELQINWLEWVRRGSPADSASAPPRVSQPAADAAVAGDPLPRGQDAPPADTVGLQQLGSVESTAGLDALVPLPTAVWPRQPSAAPLREASVLPVAIAPLDPDASWYEQQRDAAQPQRQDPSRSVDLRPTVPPPGAPPQGGARPSPRISPRTEQVLLEWSRLDRPQDPLRR